MRDSISVRSSSSESKPPASTAKSSSSSGRRFSLTSFTSTRERGVLAGELLGRVVVREGQLDGALLARRGALELVLEAGDQAPRAELHDLAAALAALERLAVDRADVVHDHEVALGGGALDRLERGERLAQALELGLHLLLVDLRLAPAHLDALVVAELRRRHHADLDREGERRALLGEVGEVDLRVADGLDPGVRERLLVPGGQPAADRLVEHGLAAHLAQHDLRRHLAAAEAGHAHLAAELRRRALQLALERLGGHLDLHAHARVGELCDVRLHGRHGTADCSGGASLPPCAARPPRGSKRGSSPARSAISGARSQTWS